MCAIGYYLEREGIMTTSISLVRENAEDLQPPRTLWVTFALGRPLGVPNDPAFQRDVLRGGLRLLELPIGPVLEDYPHDAHGPMADDVVACPVSFPSQIPAQNVDSDTWVPRLKSELSTLQPWYELSLQRRNRTTVGLCTESMDEIVERIGQFAEQPESAMDLKWMKLALEDAKAYYLEALTAQPGQYDRGAVQSLLWNNTALGQAMRSLAAYFRSHDQLKSFARILEPREALWR